MPVDVDAELLRRARAALNGHDHQDNSYEKSQEQERTSGGMEVPEFPFDAYPDAVRRLVQGGTDALGCPPDLIAVPFLGYAAAAIGNTGTLRIKRSFRQRPILWTVVVGRSGTIKTPADKVARGPIGKLQRDAAEAHEAQLEAHRTEHARWERRPADGRGDDPVKPRMPHFLTSDATFEALGPMLKQAPGIVATRDEVVGLVKACDAYRGGKGGDRQRFLEAWDGTAMKIDRRTQEPLYIAEPVLCLVGGIQPAVLPELTREASQHDGFIPRFLWSYPNPTAPEWTWDDVDDALTQRVADLLARLRTKVPYEVELSDAAKALWAEWATENARIVASQTGIAAAVASKLTVQVARIALVLHCLWHPDEPRRMLSPERLADAIMVGEYFRQHAHRVLVHFDGSGTAKGAALAARILRALSRQPGEWVSRSDLHRRLGNSVPGDDLSASLIALLDAGQIERKEEPTASKPAEFWRAAKATWNSSYEESDSRRKEDSSYEEFRSDIPAGRGIYVCRGCGLPRSLDSRPCPSCGQTEGVER